MKILFSAEDIAQCVDNLAKELNSSFSQKPYKAVILLDGALWFAADLLRALPPSEAVLTWKLSSYGCGCTSSGVIRALSPVPDVKDSHILLLDDVLDTGTTLQYAHQQLLEQGALSVTCAVMLDKQGIRTEKLPIHIASAATVPPHFVVGYGLDADGKYRNLPYIAALS